MRRTLLVGVVLAVTAVVVVLLSVALDLELESVALLGAAMGAVVALVPDRSPGSRVAGFVGGFVVAWVGYLLRAAWLPDTSGGRAVAVGLVVLGCVAICAATRDRVALWSTLLGAGSFAGAYEFTYDVAPPEVASTSLSAATTMLLNVAIGFLVVAVVAPTVRRPGAAATGAAEGRHTDRTPVAGGTP